MIGALAIGLAQHVGMLRGLIQTRVRLGVWKESLLWDREQFYRFTEGSAARRLGYEHWLRNIAVALGNIPTNASIIHARHNDSSVLVREHTNWALKQHNEV